MPLLSLESLLTHLVQWDERRLAHLLSLRPDLLQAEPSDLTVLAVRLGSETSLRQHLQRLDAPQLRVLAHISRTAAGQDSSTAADTDGPAYPEVTDPGVTDPDGAADPGVIDPAVTDPRVTESLASAGMIFASPDAAHPWAAPSRLPHILYSLENQFPQLRTVTQAPALTPPEALRQSPALSQTQPPGILDSIVENASLASISELLDDVTELLAILEAVPAATLRTGGIGMRELRRIAGASARWGAASPNGSRTKSPAPAGLGGAIGSDASVGEIGWLLELSAACGLIELTGTASWSPSQLAALWRAAARHHQHQLLVSGWLIAPRTPMLLRGPHPTSRIAPTLGLDRQRGDAEQLRRVLLETALQLDQNSAGRRAELYALNLPEDDLPGADALTGSLHQHLQWQRPLLSARITPLLPWLIREAERLGLFAAGALSAAGKALLDTSATDNSAAGTSATDTSATDPEARRDPGTMPEWQPGLARVSALLATSLPAQVDTILVQSDLTAIATGALSAPSAAALADFAQREGRGAVPTYRFSTASLHRGLTRGWTAQTILDWLAQHSMTPLPSSLSTQITDAARSWRGIHLGDAGAWLRVTDSAQREALLADPELSGIGLRILAEDILISQVNAAGLEHALNAAGFNTARAAHTAERKDIRSDSQTGTSAEHTESWSLTASPWEHSPVRISRPDLQAPDPAVIDAAAAALHRAGRAAPSSSSSAGSADVIGTLRSALAARRTVTLTRVSPQGSTHRVTGVPTGMNAGRVRVRVRDDDGEAVVMLHRIASVEEEPDE